jgi:hypothetical protein
MRYLVGKIQDTGCGVEILAVPFIRASSNVNATCAYLLRREDIGILVWDNCVGVYKTRWCIEFSPDKRQHTILCFCGCHFDSAYAAEVCIGRDIFQKTIKEIREKNVNERHFSYAYATFNFREVLKALDNYLQESGVSAVLVRNAPLGFSLQTRFIEAGDPEGLALIAQWQVRVIDRELT